MIKYDFLVVGAGLFGSVFAYEAQKKGKKVLVIDKRSHIAGNLYTEKVNSINVHKYGAHIFHTNSKKVWDYINQFSVFNRYTNSPIAKYKDEIYSLPFNMHTFNKMWGVNTPEEALDKISREMKKSYTDNPSNLEEQAINLVGIDIYKKLIKGYTEKQWGRKCTDLPPFIIKRLPVRFTYDTNYFDAMYQGIPVGGYTQLFEKLLNNIDVELNTDFFSKREYFCKIANKIIFTGPIDEFFEFKFGPLEYRTVRFETELLSCDNFQGNAVVNYTDSETKWTRIIEHKWFEFGKDENGNDIKHTIISKEFSSEWKTGSEPYYPLNDLKNNLLYQKYFDYSKFDSSVLFGGRLGKYKYYDMDQTVEAALELSKRILF